MNGLFSNVVFIKDMEEYQSIQIIVKPVNLKKKYSTASVMTHS